MAIVLLTRMNFTSKLKECVDNTGVEGILASALLGSLPDKQKIYIDTKYVMAATSCIKLEDVDEVIFQITLASPLKDGQQVINIKGEEYEDFIRIWREEREYLAPGVYKVGLGQDCKKPWAKPASSKMWAEISEDGLTVTVKEEIPV